MDNDKKEEIRSTIDFLRRAADSLIDTLCTIEGSIMDINEHRLQFVAANAYVDACNASDRIQELLGEQLARVLPSSRPGHYEDESGRERKMVFSKSYGVSLDEDIQATCGAWHGRFSTGSFADGGIVSTQVYVSIGSKTGKKTILRACRNGFFTADPENLEDVKAFLDTVNANHRKIGKDWWKMFWEMRGWTTEYRPQG